MSSTHPESYSGPCLPSSGPRLSRRLSRKEGRRTSAPARLEARGRLELGRSWHQEGRFLVERLLLDLLQSLRSTISRKYLQPIPTV